MSSPQAVERSVAPGVSYQDMHKLAERVLLEQMVKAGLFKGDVKEMQEARSRASAPTVSKKSQEEEARKGMTKMKLCQVVILRN